MLYGYGIAYFYIFHIYAAFWSKGTMLTFFPVCVTRHKTDLTRQIPDGILVPVPKRVIKHSNPSSATKFLLTWGVQIDICQLTSHSLLIKWPFSIKLIVLPGAISQLLVPVSSWMLRTSWHPRVICEDAPPTSHPSCSSLWSWY
jgi:hypothetical protein